jgi:hypothetical protein
MAMNTGIIITDERDEYSTFNPPSPSFGEAGIQRPTSK